MERKSDRSPKPQSFARPAATATVLPLARCREILGPLADGLSDAEVDQAREAALELARMLLEVLKDHGGER